MTVTDPYDASAADTVQVTVAYPWSAVLQPINAEGSSVFNLCRTVPVKFRLTGASAGITDATAKLACAKISNGVAGEVNEATSTSAVTTGSLFRYDAAAGQYVFNWNTKGLTNREHLPVEDRLGRRRRSGR